LTVARTLEGEIVMRYFLGLMLLVFLGAVTVFAMQNGETITVRFGSWQQTTTLAFLTVCVYFLGMLSGWSVVGFLRRSFHRVTAPPRVSHE
jgi:hypothetical protein